MNATVARWLYYSAQAWRGEPVRRVLRELEDSQRWPLERLRSLQWERQLALARHAYQTVPWYRRQWDEAGLAPDALRTPADWDRLPILDKPTLQRSAAELTSSLAPRGLKAATSGSAGTPVAVLRSHLSWAHAHANVIRGWHWHGVEAGERYAYLWGLALDRPGRRQASLKDAFFNRERCSAFGLDAASTRSFYQRLLRRPARWAFGYPSALTRFADELVAAGLDGRALRWKVAIATAEVLHPHQRERIAETFGCRVADSYGCAEAGVAGFECEAGGMHVPVESVVVDLLPAGDGRFEVLLTDLHNRSQPLIRYRVGDLVEPASAGAGGGVAAASDGEGHGTPVCGCGRALPLLGRPFGRAGDTLELPDGRRMNANQPSYVFKHHGKAGTVREYQFVQFPGGRIELRILPGPAWSEGVRAALREEVREALGLAVEVRPVQEIERRGRGKHRDFVRAEEIGEASPPPPPGGTPPG